MRQTSSGAEQLQHHEPHLSHHHVPSATSSQALRAALISLLRRKNYDQITVQDLIGEADVGRSTFYAHCRGKEDPLRLGLSTLRAELAEAPAPARLKPRRRFSFSLRILEHVAAHREDDASARC